MTMTVPQWDLSDRLRKALDGSAYQVQEISDALGVSRATVSRWMNGRSRPTRGAIIAWAALTDVLVWWLETGAEEPPGDAVGALSGAARPKGLEPLTFWFGADIDRAADDFLRCLGLEPQFGLVPESTGLSTGSASTAESVLILPTWRP